MAPGMTPGMTANPGSFRDPAGRVYEAPNQDGARILRGLRADALAHARALLDQAFFRDLLARGKVVESTLLAGTDALARVPLADGWAGVMAHARVPFISYPYEWPFSMLKDAALLQLECLERALESGWTLKDATPFNIQWRGARPVFIDIPSFEPWAEGEAWLGYRQFCAMFLTPLLLRAHLGIDHLPLLRSCLDGIPPPEGAKYFQGRNKLRRGVLSHLVFPARVERFVAKRERDNAPARTRAPRRFSKPMVLGLVQSMARLVRRLDIGIAHTDWSHYDRAHSYAAAEHAAKAEFVRRHVAARRPRCVWDLGCNTGTFSRIGAEVAELVVAVDGDHDAVEQLYRAERQAGGGKILPLVMNLANISPAQGWAGAERMAFDGRGKPDMVLCLALIHHMRVSANIPNEAFLRWLRGLDAEVVVEFVNREDEMFEKLLANRKERFEDYSPESFVAEAGRYFTIRERMELKGGKREIFALAPA